MHNTTTEQAITITIDTVHGPEDHSYIIDNRAQGIALVEEQRAKGYKVGRYIFMPLDEFFRR